MILLYLKPMDACTVIIRNISVDLDFGHSIFISISKQKKNSINIKTPGNQMRPGMHKPMHLHVLRNWSC